MPLTLDNVVRINLSFTAIGVTRPGFGVGALVTHKAGAWTEKRRVFTSADDVAADPTFGAASPEYLFAVRYFMATTKPTSLYIINGGTGPTMVQTISVKSIGADGTVYRANIFNQGVAQTISYTKTTGNTNDDVIAGLKASYDALNGSAWQANHGYSAGDKVYNDTAPVKVYVCTQAGNSAGSGGPTGTGSGIVDNAAKWDYVAPKLDFTSSNPGAGGSKKLVLTGDAAGNWIAIECPNRALLGVAETYSADPTTALTSALNAVVAEDNAWYELKTLFAGAQYVAACAAWTETHGKLFSPVSHDTDIPTVADASATDSAHAAKGLSYKRTFIGFHPRAWEFADAAKSSYWLPVDPGKDNWRMKSYTGVTVEPYTPTEITNMLDKRVWFYVALNPTLFVDFGDGKTAGGYFIDDVRGLDWWSINLQADGVEAIAANNRIPYTQAGAERIANIVRRRNTLGIQQGVIANDPAPTVTVPTVAEIDAAVKRTRNLPGVKVSFTTAGGINGFTVEASVSQ